MFKPTCLALSLCLLSMNASAETLVIYSARAEQMIKPLLVEYQKLTNVEIKLVSDKEGPLMERLKAEGANSPADILLTVDAGNLWQAAQMNLLKPIQSSVLNTNIPAHLRDPKGLWFGMSIRARTIFYNPNKVNVKDLSSYADLAQAKWKNRLCLRTSKKVYNQSLVAMLLEQNGVKATESIVKGWVDNLAAPVFADDTKLLEAIAAGQCDVGIANSYYYGRLLDKTPNLPVKLFWADQKAQGVHVNVSGAGVTKFSKNEKGAVKFLEWLSGPVAQNLFADVDYEFPANPKIKADSKVLAWGSFKQNLINVNKAGSRQAEATMLMDRMGYK